MAKPNKGDCVNKYSEEMMASIKQYRRMLFRMIFMVLLTGFALVFTTIAWFASNKEVGGQVATVSIATPSAGLFIDSASAGVLNQYNKTVTITANSTNKLFPISTADCKKWYYMDGISGESGAEKAVSYALANPDPSTGVYANSYENGNKCAFVLAQFIVYTDMDESADVYLNPENPIVVTNSLTHNLTHVSDAVRIGIVAEGDNEGEENLLLVYAPAAETVAGNGQSQIANQFYAIREVNSTGTLTPVQNGEPYVLAYGGAAEGSNNIGYYTAKAKGTGGSTDSGYETVSSATKVSKKICKATQSGKTIKVYIWLEGTDGQAVISDQNVNFGLETLDITINLVGISQS